LTVWLANVTGMVDPDTNLVARPLLEERVRTGWYSVFAAVVAGTAGTIAVIKRQRETLIGIVATIALVPAGAAGGIAIYAGDAGRGIGGFVLLTVNVAVIVALGLLVLLIARPGRRQANEREHRPDR
jgi:uncharacterized membrane protein